ncbi:18238_t:CDS:2, partial [Racocetra fulgida]
QYGNVQDLFSNFYMGQPIPPAFAQAQPYTHPIWQQFPNQQGLFPTSPVAGNAPMNPIFTGQQAALDMSSHNLTPEMQFSQHKYRSSPSFGFKNPNPGKRGISIDGVW